MNKKYLVYSFSIMLLMACNPSFSMYKWIFRGAKTVGKVTLPILGGALAYEQYKGYDKFCQDINTNGPVSAINNAPLLLLGGIKAVDKPVPVEVEKWIRKNMEQHGDSSLQTSPIALIAGDIPAAAVFEVLTIGAERAEELNNALQNKADNSKAIVDENAMILRHEIKHMINHDSKKGSMYATGLVPIAVEAACSGTTYVFNKICGIEAPKRFLGMALRSSVAIGSIAPKLALNFASIVFYKRYREAQADKFACEHAETKEELEEFAKFFKKYENPALASKSRTEVRLLEAQRYPIHPAPIDRREMVESYINKRDKEHNNA